MPIQASDPTPQPPLLPPRPACCRPGSSRTATACFWTVLLLFFASIVFLGILAWTRNEGQQQPESGINGHIFFGLLLVGFAISVIIGVLSTHHNHGQHREP